MDGNINSREAVEKQDIKISVIMPIYNAYDYLRPAVESVLDQTVSEIELICVDDGSVDHSLDILKEYQQKDSRIKIITQDNRGPARARNVGLENAVGEFVIFLDADDFFEPVLLEELYACAVEKDLDIAISKYDIYNSKKAVFQENPGSPKLSIFNGGAVTSKNEHPDDILESTTGSAWNKLFRHSFIKEKSLYFLEDVMMFEDVFFTVIALAFAERVSLVPKVLVHHRIYNDQSRARHFKRYYSQVPEVYLKIKEFLMKGGMYEPLSKGYLNLSASRCLYVYSLLKGEDREKFWNMLHNEYHEKLGWQSHVAEDFDKKDVCEFAANVDMYSFNQYQNRCRRGFKLDNTRIDKTLKQSHIRKRIGEFLKSPFRKRVKGK